MTYCRINEQVINKYITNLKLSTCVGPDEISPRILKMTVDNTSKALSLIFNRSILQGKILGEWKSANVVPIFKKGSKDDKNNYGPVSLISIIYKLLESIIRDQVQRFLDENK